MMKRRMFNKSLAMTLTVGALILAGCSTVEMRIEENPQLFQSLSSRDQELVSRGQIRIGMTTDAVWLAWGNADQKARGAMRNQSTETWVYTTTTSYPYGGHGFYGGYGYGGPGWGGPYGPWGYGGGIIRSRHGRRFAYFGSPFYDPFYYSYIPTVTIPYKTVTFANGRAVSFQYLVAPYR